jgi:alpha-D-xyloside xylohydrolase
LERVPLFVRAGSILPLGPVVQHTGEQPSAPVELRIYPGADATFTLYEDDGETYAYEHGERATCELTWDDAARTLRLGARQGSFPGMAPTRRIEVRLCGTGKPTPSRTITYDGSAQIVHFP